MFNDQILNPQHRSEPGAMRATREMRGWKGRRSGGEENKRPAKRGDKKKEEWVLMRDVRGKREQMAIKTTRAQPRRRKYGNKFCESQGKTRKTRKQE